MQALMVLLASKFPKVRRFTAEKLYTAGVLVQARLNRGSAAEFWIIERSHVMLDILASTAWDGAALDAVTAARGRLIALLGLDPPKVKHRTSSGQPALSKAAMRGNADENASYQALVDDFARGL